MKSLYFGQRVPNAEKLRLSTSWVGAFLHGAHAEGFGFGGSAINQNSRGRYFSIRRSSNIAAAPDLIQLRVTPQGCLPAVDTFH